MDAEALSKNFLSYFMFKPWPEIIPFTIKLEPKKSEEFKNIVNFLQDRQQKTYTRIFRD